VIVFGWVFVIESKGGLLAYKVVVAGFIDTEIREKTAPIHT